MVSRLVTVYDQMVTTPLTFSEDRLKNVSVYCKLFFPPLEVLVHFVCLGHPKKPLQNTPQIIPIKSFLLPHPTFFLLLKTYLDCVHLSA